MMAELAVERQLVKRAEHFHSRRFVLPLTDGVRLQLNPSPSHVTAT